MQKYPSIDPSNLRNEQDALEHSITINRIAMKLLNDRARDCRKLRFALLLSIGVNFLAIFIYIWHIAIK